MVNLSWKFKTGKFTIPRFMFSRGRVYNYNILSMNGWGDANIFVQATAIEKPNSWSIFSRRQYSVYIKDNSNALDCGNREFFITGIMAKKIYYMMLR